MKKIEFSKIIIGTTVITWFAGAIFGAYIVNEEHSQLNELLTYIGAPAATAFGFYAWKARAENIVKLNKLQLDKLNSVQQSSNERV